MPVLTELSVIPEQVRLTSEVLEIVRIYTLGLVVFMVVRTPFCFEEEYIEVKILISWQKMMDESHLNIFDRVCKGAVFTIFTLLNFGRKLMTKLGFVLVFVIQALDSVVGPPALVLLRTFLRLSKLTKLRCI